MKSLLKSKKIYKIILFLGFLIYVASIFINQQKSINAYKNEQEYIAEKINEQNEYKETLASMKENINSPEYIEEIAREKLNMYLPNERVYIDIGK